MVTDLLAGLAAVACVFAPTVASPCSPHHGCINYRRFQNADTVSTEEACAPKAQPSWGILSLSMAFKTGMETKALAERYSINVKSVRKVLRENGMKKPPGYNTTPRRP